MSRKAVIFDLDGTLADSAASIAYSANRAIEECGFQGHPVECYKKFAGDGAKKMLERSLFAAGDKELQYFEKVQARYHELFKADCMYEVKPYEGICELLAALKERGVRLAVLSNKPHARAVDVVESLFGERYFDCILGQTEDMSRKPSPEGAFRIAEIFGVEPDQCLYVGDTNTDMQTGRAAGMHTVGVTWGFRERAELEESGAQVIIDHPMELIEEL